MMKKIGLALAVATAGLLAVSPLALADEHHGSIEEDSAQLNSIDGDRSQTGLVNVGDVETNDQSQACGNDVVNTPGAVSDVSSELLGPLEPVLGLLAPGSTEVTNESGAVAATTTTVSCSQTGGTGDSVSQTNSGS